MDDATLDPIEEESGIEPDAVPQKNIADFMLHSRLAGHSWPEIHALLSRLPANRDAGDLNDRLSRMARQNLGSNNG